MHNESGRMHAQAKQEETGQEGGQLGTMTARQHAARLRQIIERVFGALTENILREIAQTKKAMLAQVEQALLPPLSPEEKILRMHIAELGLDQHTYKPLFRQGITYVYELMEWNADDLLTDARLIGVTRLTKIREKLASLGLKLKGD